MVGGRGHYGVVGGSAESGTVERSRGSGATGESRGSGTARGIRASDAEEKGKEDIVEGEYDISEVFETATAAF